MNVPLPNYIYKFTNMQMIYSYQYWSHCCPEHKHPCFTKIIAAVRILSILLLLKHVDRAYHITISLALTISTYSLVKFICDMPPWWPCWVLVEAWPDPGSCSRYFSVRLLQAEWTFRCNFCNFLGSISSIIACYPITRTDIRIDSRQIAQLVANWSSW